MEKWKSGEYVGDLEKFVMLAILGKGNESYGVAIREELHRETGRSISYSAIYTTLERLEKKGMVTSRLGEATPERGGRAKLMYQVTGLGQRALNESKRVLMRLGFAEV